VVNRSARRRGKADSRQGQIFLIEFKALGIFAPMMEMTSR